MYFPLLLESMSGLRRGELLALRWEDIDLEKKVIHVHRNRVYAGGKVYEKHPKTESSIRDITFGDRMKEAMAEEYQRYLDLITVRLEEIVKNASQEEVDDWRICVGMAIDKLSRL
jgi:hypothetical protein